MLMVILVPTLLSTQSLSWFNLWLMMEISVVSVCMMLLKEKWKEKTLLFFLFQMLSSASLLFYLLISAVSPKMIDTPSKDAFVIMTIMVKMALFPIHLWIIKLSKTMKWLTLMIMSTWQKVIPVIFLMSISKMKVLLAISLISMVITNIMLMSISLMKSFMAISSSIHSSWMVISSLSFKLLALVYLALYSIISISIFPIFEAGKKKSTVNQSSEKIFSGMKIGMMSIAGAPPLLGFLGKVVVLVWMVKAMLSKFSVVSVLLVSLMSMYSYYQLIMKKILILSSKVKQKISEKMNSKVSFLTNNLTVLVALLI